MKKKMDPNSKRWEEAANRLARLYVPEIYPCMKCGYPVVRGYVCTGCDDNNPSSPT